MSMLPSSAIQFDISTHHSQVLPIEELHIDLQDKNKIYWIHVDLNQQDIFQKIAHQLEFSDDLIQLCNQKNRMPQVDEDENALTIQAQCLLSTDIIHNSVKFGSLIIHLTPNYCFTASLDPLPALIDFMKNHHKAMPFAKTPCFILFLIFDNIVTEYGKNLFHFEVIAEKMDSRVRKNQNIYHRIMHLKQQVLKVKRYLMSIREILMRISGRKIFVISDQCRSSLYNLSNHTHMVINETDSIRDMLKSLLDQIDNTLIQKMNETMKVLTAFNAIFLPLTLITGIYGMNFHWMPELQWKYGYFYAVFLLFICGSALFLVFKKKKWF